MSEGALATTDIAIVGGGPVGCYLGALLAQCGAEVTVLERRAAPFEHSRAIGIHPRALVGFERLGLMEHLLAEAVKIPRGLLLGERQQVLGELSFASARPFPYVLSLPQVQTEKIIAKRLLGLAPQALRRGIEVKKAHHTDAGWQLALSDNTQLKARLLVAADGWRSALRESMGISFAGGTYPDRYLMGDFPDTTPFGSSAMIALHRHGVTESFPLPKGHRRWVVHTGHAAPNCDPACDPARPNDVALLSDLVRERTGLPLPEQECSMVSAFGVRRHLAARMALPTQGFFLIGDAAHVVSPIGGQGMNLGWLDADALAPLLMRGLSGGVSASEWKAFERARRRAAWLAARGAELNMSAGRPCGEAQQRGREKLLRALLGSFVSPLLAQAFTMRWH